MQTMTEPLVELPGWLQAAGWGGVAASGLLIGAAGGYYTPLQHATIAGAMTFAAGVLLAVVAVDLLINASGAASLHWTVMGMLCGAAVFSCVNWVLCRRGAQHRKRCGECVEQPQKEQQPGSGLAIAAGSLLDGVPEGLVLRVGVLHHGAPGLGTVAAFFLANIAEALSRCPGTFSSDFHHARSAFIYAYVLSGAIRSQAGDEPVRVYRSGETWFEKPGDYHRVSENASDTEPARLLAVLIVDAADEPLVIPAPE